MQPPLLSGRNLENHLSEFLSSRLPGGDSLEPETDLLEAGWLDSLVMMELTAHIEAEYGIRLDHSDISPKNFRTVRSVAALITSKRTPAPATATGLKT